MSEDINNPNNTEIPLPNINNESSSYKDATALGNDWESTELPMTPTHEVVVVSGKKGIPIIIPLFIIVLGIFIGVSFLLLKQIQNRNIQNQVQTSSPVNVSPTGTHLVQATPSAGASISAVPTQTSSDNISDIENDLNKMDTSTLDIR